MSAFAAEYGMSADFGPYTGELDNGGEGLALVDRAGQAVDILFYDDAGNWPVGADAMGADDEFLQNSPYRAWALANPYKSLSLSRRDNDLPSDSGMQHELVFLMKD